MAQDTGDISFLLNLNTNTWILPCVLHVCSWGNSSTCDNGTNCDLLTPLSPPPFPSPCSFFCSPDPRRLPTSLATDFLLRSREGEEFLYAHGPGDLRLFLVESGLGPGSPFCQQNPGKGGPRKPSPPQGPPEPAFFSNHASFQGLSGIWRQEPSSSLIPYFRLKGDSTEGREGQRPAGALVSGPCSGPDRGQDQSGLRGFWVREEFYGVSLRNRQLETAVEQRACCPRVDGLTGTGWVGRVSAWMQSPACWQPCAEAGEA